ncbi:MAG TPA: hypothetical protein IAB35_05905 [Candidatus Faecimonas gallistercoris]|nr:hypothetical protein [Candidatus Faecimonas gallistercoris]
MTKSVKILFTLGFIFIVFGLITNFTVGFKQDKKEVEKRMKIVNSTYEIFKKKVQKFNTTRDDLYNNVFSQLYFETLNQTITNCLQELQNYETQLDKVENSAKKLQKNCENIYFPSADVNTKCKTYATSYEEIVNYFINDIKQVNDNIEEYNNYNQENKTGIAPIQKYNTTKDYIDFNQDKEYAGKEDF